MKQQIENIIAKVLAGEASSGEIKIAEQFKKENPHLFVEYEKAYRAKIFENKQFDKAGDEWNAVRSKTKTAGKSFSLLFRIAAVFAGLILLASLFFLTRTGKVLYKNNTGKLMSVVLPDHSKVILDKDAELFYSTSIMKGFHREVSMKGRIFFHVAKDPQHPFTVNGSMVRITVLGTRFTVNELDSHTQVFLTEGRVKVKPLSGSRSMIISDPGEQVMIDRKGIFRHEYVNERLYASWTKNKIYFDNCTVEDLIGFVNDSYGMNITVNDSLALKKKLYGSAPSDDPDLIIKAISRIIKKDINKN